MCCTQNILFCGLGGQGILLASEITAYGLIEAGFAVKKSEIHGMAQRGGSVVAHLRYGKSIFSPVIDVGTTDIEVAFEAMEAIRPLPFLKKESRVIVNDQKIAPAAVAAGIIPYPKNIFDELRGRGINVIPIDGLAISRDAGSTRAVNMAMVGALSSLLPVPEQYFLDAIARSVENKFTDINIKAFQGGRAVTKTLK